jgi:hypothetical protein
MYIIIISGVGGVINGLANTVNVLSQVLEDTDVCKIFKSFTLKGLPNEISRLRVCDDMFSRISP